MNSKTLYSSFAVAFAGFLFGFDTVVISGANIPIKETWQTSPWFHGVFIMSMALWGTVLGALMGGIPSDRYGRKTTLLGVGILFFISALGSALAPDPYSFSIFRFIGGIGVGVSSVAAPVYISEISSPNRRGRLVALYQLNLVFGIFIAFLSNYLLKGFDGANDWRWMLGVEAIPAAIFILLVPRIIASPRWLISKRSDEKAALVALEQTTGDPDTARSMLEDIKKDFSETSRSHSIFSRPYFKPLMLAFLVAFFNQMSGINFILYYAPELLEKAGLTGRDSLFNSISIGATNLVFTLLGMYLIDLSGRKRLLLVGSLGYIVSLTAVSYGYYAHLDPAFLMIFFCIFIASHAVGQGAVIWVYIAEVFPNQVRASGQSWGSGTHWVLAASLTMLAPTFIDAEHGIFADNPYPVFAFFSLFMVLQLLFVIFLMPETKGVSLEDLQRKITGRG